MKLSDVSLRGIKATGKIQKYHDGGWLYLHVTPTGGKLWRMGYRFEGKQKTLSFGAYPAVSLKEARQKSDKAKEIIAKGVDPGTAKKEARIKAAAVAREEAVTFAVTAREWYAKKTIDLSPGYRQKIMSHLEKQLFPYIGNIPFSKIEPVNILAAVRHAEERGTIETAHRLAQLAGQVCRYARLAGYTKYDAAAGLTEALSPVQRKHYAAITDPKEIGHLLRAIDEYQGEVSICYALRVMPYVFVRSMELRGAEWSEINFDAAEWIIPAGRMKMKRPHVVPLARQAIKLLDEIGAFTGGGRLVFPGAVSVNRCISDMGLLNALRRLGYGKEQMTVHGFRSMASTRLNEMGYRPDVIEAQLAHGDQDAVRSAYNRASYLPERRRMMQEWADTLDELREGK